MLSGLYVEGDSWLHRVRPGVKLVGLLVFTTCLLVWSGVVAVVVGGVVVVVAVLCGGLGWLWLWRGVWGLRWLVMVLGVVQVVVNGVFDAFVVVGGLLVAVVAASVVTATTRTVEMMDAVVVGVRPLRCVGVDADRVGLVFSLVLRSVFVVAGIVEEVGQARKARGLERSFRALLVPVVVRTVRHGERVGEALVARGVDD